MAIPLYESVLSSMRDKISSRDWVAGDLIPREVDLCKQYGVSRSTIRMAMSRLVEEGLLTRVKGVGTYVSSEVHLQDTTLFINSFAQDLEKRGLIPCTELLSFRTVPAIPEINEKLALAPDARLLQMTRLRYPKDAFATGAPGADHIALPRGFSGVFPELRSGNHPAVQGAQGKRLCTDYL